jgi:hypothetical protein
MTVRAEGSNAPLRRKEKAMIERKKKLAAQYLDKGETPEKAEELAQAAVSRRP